MYKEQPKSKSPVKQKKKKRRNKEKLSLREIEDLMGMHMDVYTRRNGAIRRK